jgi:hypothetical protein
MVRGRLNRTEGVMRVRISGIPVRFRDELRAPLRRAVRREFRIKEELRLFRTMTKSKVQIVFVRYPKAGFLWQARRRKWVYVDVGHLPAALQEPVTLAIADVCFRHSGDPKRGRGRWWYQSFEPTHLLALDY